MIALSQTGDTLSPVDKCSDSWGPSGLSIGTTTAFVVEPSVLQILGSDAGDFILVVPEGDNAVRVSTWLGSSSETRQTYDLTDVTRIEVSAGGGNDFVFVSRSLDLPILLQGGAGSDFLRGANHSNLLLGGAGNDLLVGGLGRDVLIGGTDADLLMAYAGEDVLLGEVADNSVGQLLAAWESWIAPDDVPVREAAIRLIINPAADSAADFLFGGPDQALLLTVESGEGEIAATQAAEAGSTDLTIALRGMSGMALVGSNPIDPHDVNGDGDVMAIDALSIIDDINTNGPTLLHEQVEGSGVCSLDTLAGPWNELAGCFQVWSGGGLLADVNPDDRISPLDVLIVINRINASVVGEGEADGSVAVGGMTGELDSGFMPGIGANPINDLAVHAILGEWTNPEFGFEGRIDDDRIKRASMEFTDPAGADVSLAAAKDDATAGYGRTVDLLFDAEGQNRLDLDLLGDRLSVLRADA